MTKALTPTFTSSPLLATKLNTDFTFLTSHFERIGLDEGFPWWNKSSQGGKPRTFKGVFFSSSTKEFGDPRKRFSHFPRNHNQGRVKWSALGYQSIEAEDHAPISCISAIPLILEAAASLPNRDDATKYIYEQICSSVGTVFIRSREITTAIAILFLESFDWNRQAEWLLGKITNTLAESNGLADRLFICLSEVVKDAQGIVSSL